MSDVDSLLDDVKQEVANEMVSPMDSRTLWSDVLSKMGYVVTLPGDSK